MGTTARKNGGQFVLFLHHSAELEKGNLNRKKSKNTKAGVKL